MDWQEIAKYLWTALVPAGWWIFKKQDERVNNLEKAMDKKADETEMDRQRDNITSIFEKIDEHARRDEQMHNTILGKLHDMHVDLLEKIRK